MTRIDALVSDFRLARPRFSFLRMFSVMEERRRLAEMSDAQLDDIGITRAEALREARRPFWNLPAA
ncbi:MAG: DUF1127 domain-containing protein [Pseudomonadota bacterium]